MVSATISNVVSRSVNSCPNTLGAGMPSNPFQPPVRPLHSTAPCSTTNPNAIVTIARYGPRMRSAGTASARPAIPEITIAAGSATQKLKPAFVVRMPTV